MVVADYHKKHAEGMVKAARKVLQGHKVKEVRVPGTFEVPLAVKRALRKKPDAVLALGLVWQGETAHADLILKSATEALMRMMLETEVPILHHLVGVKTEKQARERCLGKLNRGREAAQAALRMWKLQGVGRGRYAQRGKDFGGSVPVSTGSGDFEHSVGRSAEKSLGANRGKARGVCFCGKADPGGHRKTGGGRCRVEEVSDELGARTDGPSGSGHFEISFMGDEICRGCGTDFSPE